MKHMVRTALMTSITIYLLAVAAAGPALSSFTLTIVAILGGLPAFALVAALIALEKQYPVTRFIIPLLGLFPLFLFAVLALGLGVKGFGNTYSSAVMTTGFGWTVAWYSTSVLNNRLLDQ
jgi:hypothetical protein